MIDLTAPDLDTTLRVSEIFGPTFQGEGPLTGRRCAFVRFGLCNLSCRWCDTPYTWDWTGVTADGPFDKAAEVQGIPLGDVVEQINLMRVHHVVITGGEPLVQARAFANLAGHLMNTGYRVEVETNGTIVPPADVTMRADFLGALLHWNVSPKLAGSGMDRAERIKPPVLAWFAEKGATFKFVITGPKDVDEVATLIDEFDLDRSAVWLMPEGRNAGAIVSFLPAVADAARELGVNLTGRLHTITWGSKRGR